MRVSEKFLIRDIPAVCKERGPRVTKPGSYSSIPRASRRLILVAKVRSSKIVDHLGLPQTRVTKTGSAISAEKSCRH